MYLPCLMPKQLMSHSKFIFAKFIVVCMFYDNFMAHSLLKIVIAYHTVI